MSDAMDVDRPGPPPSRDPRIANRHNAPPTTSPRIGTGSLESQRNASLASPKPRHSIPPVAAGSPVLQPGGLPQILLDSMQACVAIAMDNAMQDKVQQHNRRVDALLQKAKLSPGFRSTVEGFQSANEKGKADLKDINEAKKKHESEWHRTSKILEATLSSASPQTSNVEERIARLENNYGEKLTNQRKEYEERLNSQATQLGKTIAELQSQVTQAKSDINDINKRLDQTGNISQKMTEGLQNVQDEFSALKASVRNQLAPLEQVKESVEPKASPMPPIVSPELESKINDVMSRLQSLEGAFAKYPPPSFDVDATVKSLSEQIRSVQTLLDMRNDFEGSEANELKNKMAQQTEEVNKKLAQETEELNKKFAHQTEELNSLKAAHSHLSNEMRNMGNSIVHSNSTVSQNFNGLSVTIDRLQRINETIKTGLHSLETRYNNLTTEHVVKNMATVMQEMYPSTAHLSEQITRLNTSVDNKLSCFQSTVDQLFQAQNAGTGDVGRLRQEYGRLSESVKTLYDTCQTPLLKLPGQMDSLEKKTTDLEQSMDRNIKQLEEELGAREKANSETMQKLEAQRDRTDVAVEWIENHGKKIELMQQLPEAIQKLHSDNSALTRQVGNVSRQLINFVDDLEQVKGKSIDLNDISHRVSRMEESASTAKSGVKANTEREKTQTNDGSPLPSREEDREGSQKPRSNSKSQDKERASESQQKGDGNSTAYISQMAETNPALSLREKKKNKKKKKRTLSPSPSEDGTASVQPSIGGSSVFGSVADSGEKKKKKKKRKTQEGEAVLSG